MPCLISAPASSLGAVQILVKSGKILMEYLLRHSGSDLRLLQDWVSKTEKGLLPYAGTWHTPESIERLIRQARRRSWLVLLELLILFGVVLALNVLGFRFFDQVISFLSF